MKEKILEVYGVSVYCEYPESLNLSDSGCIYFKINGKLYASELKTENPLEEFYRNCKYVNKFIDPLEDQDKDQSYIDFIKAVANSELVEN